MDGWASLSLAQQRIACVRNELDGTAQRLLCMSITVWAKLHSSPSSSFFSGYSPMSLAHPSLVIAAFRANVFVSTKDCLNVPYQRAIFVY